MNETMTCKKCQQTYEPKYWAIPNLSVHILRGNGLCPVCSKNEYDEEVKREESIQVAKVAADRRRAREHTGIPPRFMTEDFSTFAKGWQDNALKTTVDYAEQYPVERYPRDYRSLYLWSVESWGTGKTHLSCAILHRILDRWQGGRLPNIKFLSEPELFSRITATYSFNREEKQIRESEDDILRQISGADLVVLDDVGKLTPRDLSYVQDRYFKIFDARYKNMLPIIITANLAPEGLKNHLGQASFDRFYPMIEGKIIKMEGRSYRRK